MRRLVLGLSAAFLAVTAGLSLSGSTALAATGSTAQAPQPAATAPAGQDPVVTVTTTSGFSPATPSPSCLVQDDHLLLLQLRDRHVPLDAR